MRRDRFINRDWRRTEEDDFKLNVQDSLGPDTNSEATPQYLEGQLIGWTVQRRF